MNILLNNNPIPKIIYRTWCSNDTSVKCGGRNLTGRSINITNNTLKDWKQIIMSDDQIDKFIIDTYGPDHKYTQAYYIINKEYSASRSDLARLLIIYNYGGLYLDMKSCVVRDIPTMPADMDMWVSNWESGAPHSYIFYPGGEYQNWYIYARKKSPILLDIIEFVVHNILFYYNTGQYKTPPELILAESPSKGKVLLTTGPIALTFAILNSNHKNKVIVDSSINDSVKYECDIPLKQYIRNTDKKHYSNLLSPYLKIKDNIFFIPKNIYFTYYDLQKIPKYVIDNINKYCSGYNILYYDDNKCIDFLQHNFGNDYVTIFNNFKLGPHKADFFRFCILYLYGGFYFDIKTNFQKHIDTIFKPNVHNVWYTVICDSKKCLYNGIIVTYPRNYIMKYMIKFMILNNNNNNNSICYHIYVNEFHRILKSQCVNSYIQTGCNILKNDSKCILLDENCSNVSSSKADKYGCKCIITDNNNDINFITRYNDFPWN